MSVNLLPIASSNLSVPLRKYSGDLPSCPMYSWSTGFLLASNNSW